MYNINLIKKDLQIVSTKWNFYFDKKDISFICKVDFKNVPFFFLQ